MLRFFICGKPKRRQGAPSQDNTPDTAPEHYSSCTGSVDSVGGRNSASSDRTRQDIAISSANSNSASSNTSQRPTVPVRGTTPSPTVSKPLEDEYQGSIMPPNESQRWNYLCSLNVLDSEPEERFDDITKLCTMVFKAPIALVSLVDRERQWFKSVQGLGVNSTDRKSSFCAWTLLPVNPEVLVVENALQDARFRNNPLVLGFPHIRFYAGCPLVGSNGFRLGSLCIIDTKPRTFDAESCNMLANFAEMVVREIEKDRLLENQKMRSAALSAENVQLLRAIDCFSEGIMLCNLSAQGWPVLFVNEAWQKLTGMPRVDAMNKRFWDLFTVPGTTAEIITMQHAGAINNMQGFELSVAFGSPSGRRMYITMQFRSAGNTQDGVLVGIPSILSDCMGPSDNPVYYFAVASEQPRTSMELSNPATAPPTAPMLTPTRKPFEDVKLGPLLGKGAYGRVYRGVWNGAPVAVKVIEHYDSPSGTQSAALEAGLHEKISHPNVVQTYKHAIRSAGPTQDSDRALLETWMVLEFCNRGSLSDGVERGWMRKQGTAFDANMTAVVATAREVAGAMCYLHSMGILHGDLTGNNILLSSSDKDVRGFVAKVADFGLSRMIAADMEHINTKTYGTVTHMPPELLLHGQLSKASDVYAFGVILWELFMGQRPYSGMGHGQIIHAITSGKVLATSRNCPPAYGQLTAMCMATQPDERPTFQQIMDVLERMEFDD